MIKIFGYNLGVIEIFILFLSTIFAVLPLYDMLINGPFSWHIQTPATKEGAIELFFMFFIYYISFKYLHKNKLIFLSIVTIVTLLYLRRHNIDLPFFINIIYVTTLYFLGSLILQRVNIKYKVPLTFLLGICIWGIYSFSLSFLYLAKVEWLVISAGLMFLISLILRKHNIIFFMFNFIKETYKKDKYIKYPFYISLFLIFSLVLLVQSSLNSGYDDLWYSLRGVEVLNQTGSFYEPIIMLQHWVSFYPKLYEVTTYPLEYFQIFTVSKMLTVFVLFFFAIAIFEVLRKKVATENTLFIIFMIVTIPAVANTSILSKADLIMAFTFFLGLMYFLEYNKKKEISYFILSIVLFLLTLAFKFSAIPYIGILSIFALIYFLYNFKNNKNNLQMFDFFIYLIILFALILTTYRTYSIVGVPFVTLAEIISPLAKIYDLFGFSYNWPFEQLTNNSREQSNLSFSEMFIKYFIFPSTQKSSYAWISNIYIVLAGLFIYNFIKLKNKIDFKNILILLLLIVFCYVLFVVTAKKSVEGGDGNYHIAAIVSIIVLISLNEQLVKYYKFLIPIIITNVILMFITNHGWSPGTNKFDLNFTKNPFTNEEIRKRNLKEEGILDIYYQLKKQANPKKVMGFGNEKNLFLLNATYESGRHISGQRSYLFKDFETFKNMLVKAKTTHLLYPKYIPNQKFVNFAKELKFCNGVDEYIGDAYVLLDIQNLDKQCHRDIFELTTSNFGLKSPTKILNDKYTTSLWMKPFSIVKGKYFPKNSIAIRNGTTIEYKDIKNSNSISLKTMLNIGFKNEQTDRSVLEIIINDTLGNEVKKEYIIVGTNVVEISIDTSHLSDKINISFNHKELNRDGQLVLIDVEF